MSATFRSWARIAFAWIRRVLRMRKDLDGLTQRVDTLEGRPAQSAMPTRHEGFHRPRCPHSPNPDHTVDATVFKGITTHVVCADLQTDFTCKAEGNNGKDCIVIHPGRIRNQRNALEAEQRRVSPTSSAPFGEVDPYQQFTP